MSVQGGLVMARNKDPKELVIKLLKRSSCAVQTAAVLTTNGIVTATGWNHSGCTGFGCHAEEMLFKRANLKHIPKSVLYVAAKRKKSGSSVMAKPCAFCHSFAKNCAYIIYRDKRNEWITMRGEL